MGNDQESALRGNVAIALVMASLLLTLVLWSGAIVVGALLLF
jgi:hypothetical protein